MDMRHNALRFITSVSTPAILSALFLACLLSASATAGVYSDAVLADDPIAYYRLDETSGTTADNLGTAGPAIDGTYVNVPGATVDNNSNYGVAGPRPAIFPGFEVDNNAVLFDPEDGSVGTDTTFPRVEVAVDDSETSPLALTGALTLEAWIKRDEDSIDTGANEGIVSRYKQDQNGGARSYVLYYESTTDGTNGSPDGTPGLGLALSSSPTGSFQSANSYEFAADIPLGEWTHVAATFDPGNRIAIYVNGKLQGEVTTGVLSDPLYSGEGDFWIGQQFNGDDAWTFQGSIDEVAVYDKALSDSQVLAHMVAAPEPSALMLFSMLAVASSCLRKRRLN